MHKYVDGNLKVWAVKPSQPALPTVLPWVESALDAMTFMRTDPEEGILLWVNLPTVGVVTSLKKDYFVQLITGLLTAKPQNSVCILLQANRAAEAKKRTGSLLVSLILTSHFVCVIFSTSMKNISSKFYAHILSLSFSCPCRDVKGEDDDEADAEGENEAAGETSGDDTSGNEATHDGGRNNDSNLLSDFQYKLDQALRSQTRGLLVKDLMISFDSDSVYGKRSGFHKALMLTVPRPHPIYGPGLDELAAAKPVPP